MDLTDYRIVWVHGVGDINPGYSDAWTKVFNEYLNFPDPANDFIEVYWRKVFLDKVNELKQNATALAETSQKQAEVHKELIAALATTQLPDLIGEWSGLIGTAQTLLPDWVLNPDAFVGEFVEYLVDKGIRDAVKEEMKAKLRPLAGHEYDISIIAHSWGTVVAYQSLLDLQQELPAFQLTNLFTLGSPLWLVRYLLDDSSGRKPGNVANWVNIHAQADLIASWLRPDFQVDWDYGVQSFPGSDPHDSYLAKGNVAVQRDIVAATILS